MTALGPERSNRRPVNGLDSSMTAANTTKNKLTDSNKPRAFAYTEMNDMIPEYARDVKNPTNAIGNALNSKMSSSVIRPFGDTFVFSSSTTSIPNEQAKPISNTTARPRKIILNGRI